MLQTCKPVTGKIGRFSQSRPAGEAGGTDLGCRAGMVTTVIVDKT
jgi:hypothetical protein